MTQIAIFNSTVCDIEKEVNAWLRNHDYLEIIDIRITSIPGTEESYACDTVLIIYRR